MAGFPFYGFPHGDNWRLTWRPGDRVLVGGLEAAMQARSTWLRMTSKERRRWEPEMREKGVYHDEGSVILQTGMVRVISPGKGHWEGLGGRLGALGLKEFRKLAEKVQGGMWSMTAANRNSLPCLAFHDVM